MHNFLGDAAEQPAANSGTPMGSHRDKRSIIRSGICDNSVFGFAFFHRVLDAGPGECPGYFLEIFLTAFHALLYARIEITDFFWETGGCLDNRYQGYRYFEGSCQRAGVWQSSFRVVGSVQRHQYPGKHLALLIYERPNRAVVAFEKFSSTSLRGTWSLARPRSKALQEVARTLKERSTEFSSSPDHNSSSISSFLGNFLIFCSSIMTWCDFSFAQSSAKKRII
jgi:hypothetical protein